MKSDLPTREAAEALARRVGRPTLTQTPGELTPATHRRFQLEEGWGERPDDPELEAALADTILKAERHAFELIDQLRAWGIEVAAQVSWSWWTLEELRTVGPQEGGALDAPLALAEILGLESVLDPIIADDGPEAWSQAAITHLYAEFTLRHVDALDDTIIEDDDRLAPLEGKGIATLPNPFTALVEIWRLGVAIEDVTPEGFAFALPFELDG